MPSSKRKPKRRSDQRPAPRPDLLRRKLHDLANTLEAVSLARHFIATGRQTRTALEHLASGIVEARKALHQMDAELRGAPRAKRHAAGR